MKMTLAAIVLVSATALPMQEASAVSRAVKSACTNDYFSFCSMHPPSSPGVRRCFRANAKRISTSCIKALKKSGYVKSSRAKLR